MELEKIRLEMGWSLDGRGRKDVVVVVRDGLPHVRVCMESLFANTEEFELHLWDNASGEETAEYLREVASRPNVRLTRSPTNEGFVVPNNRLVRECSSEWVVLLNSDTEVLPHWDELLVGTLRNNPDLAQAGYGGGVLDSECEFAGRGYGRNVDFLMGYCVCMRRETMLEFGPFDEENIRFAYCEDSDLSLRLREKGFGLYACHAEDMVRHVGGGTTSRVLMEDERLSGCAKENLAYLKRRWISSARLYGGGPAR